MMDPATNSTRRDTTGLDSKELQSLRKSLEHLQTLQWDDGRWEGEVVWNPMLLAQYVITHYVIAGPSKRELFDEPTRRKMIRYFEVTRTSDGGWGMHEESHSFVFFTTLSYVALRLLGVDANDPLVARPRSWLREGKQGRVLSIPSWGKFWLAAIGLYGYEGVNPILPELFLLPEELPVHPNRYYCHTRYIYLGIAYLYGRKFVGDLGPIRDELRREMYPQPYDSIDFGKHRHDLAKSDLHAPPSPLLRVAYDTLFRYDRRHSRAVRERALERCFERILFEMHASRYQCISPVNGLLNCLAIFARDPSHPELEPSLRGMEAWKWEDEAQGIRYAGARSSAWDTSFVLRAALEAPASAQPRETMLRGYDFLRKTQMTSELTGGDRERRVPIRGGWCFSDGEHRWPVSDCTAEALAAVLELHHVMDPTAHGHDRITDHHLRDAADFILLRQNADGGFGTYENQRGPMFLETLNPAEMFSQCMIEHSYVECTASCIGALRKFREAFPEYRPDAIEKAIERGIACLVAAQHADGTWTAAWGVHFTYAICFVVEGLIGAGVPPTHPSIARAAAWLIEHQRADGGWGEHFETSLQNRYVEHKESQVLNTSWAVMALLRSHGANAAPVKRGIAWLEARQNADGSFPKESPAGVFFGTAVLDYVLYRDYFAMWALARYRSMTG